MQAGVICVGTHLVSLSLVGHRHVMLVVTRENSLFLMEGVVMTVSVVLGVVW